MRERGLEAPPKSKLWPPRGPGNLRTCIYLLKVGTTGHTPFTVEDVTYSMLGREMGLVCGAVGPPFACAALIWLLEGGKRGR